MDGISDKLKTLNAGHNKSGAKILAEQLVTQNERLKKANEKIKELEQKIKDNS